MIWLLFIFICLLVYTIAGGEMVICYGVQSDHLWNALIYPFFHTSWLHLIVNMFSIGIMFQPICRLYRDKYNDTAYPYLDLFRYGYIASIAAGAFCATGIPTVGASGIVFFLLGVLIMLNPTKRQAKNYIYVAAAVAVQLYFGKSNVALHIVAFVEGALFIIGKEFVKQYKSKSV